MGGRETLPASLTLRSEALHIRRPEEEAGGGARGAGRGERWPAPRQAERGVTGRRRPFRQTVEMRMLAAQSERRTPAGVRRPAQGPSGAR